MGESNFILFLGRFHPLLVHLPLGFLLLAVIAELILKKSTKEKWKDAIAFTWLLGAISAGAAILLGFFLASDGSYEGEMLEWHKWAGIVTGLLALYCWLVKIGRFPQLNISYLYSVGAVVLGLIITGHLGGNLTHGEFYLFEHAPGFVQRIAGFEDDGPNLDKEWGSPDSIEAFGALVMPILEEKCIACHNENKQNGDLLLTTQEGIEEGGEGGHVIVAGKAEKSELFRRVTLAQESAKFMPPKGKILNYDEIQIMKGWIETGASFDAKLTELEWSDAAKMALFSYAGIDLSPKPFIETIDADSISREVLASLQAEGFLVNTLASGNHLLEVSWPRSKGALTMEKLALLKPVAGNITWLNLGNANVTNEMLAEIAQMQYLTRLRLENNSQLTDQGIAALSPLKHIESLNIYGTAVSNEATETLLALNSLQRLYVWQTKIDQAGIEAMLEKNPELHIDNGFSFN